MLTPHALLPESPAPPVPPLTGPSAPILVGIGTGTLAAASSVQNSLVGGAGSAARRTSSKEAEARFAQAYGFPVRELLREHTPIATSFWDLREGDTPLELVLKATARVDMYMYLHVACPGASALDVRATRTSLLRAVHTEGTGQLAPWRAPLYVRRTRTSLGTCRTYRLPQALPLGVITSVLLTGQAKAGLMWSGAAAAARARAAPTKALH